MDGITNKDILAIKLAKKHKIKNFALSFANNPTSVENFRNLIGKNSFLISKIESLEALKKKYDFLRFYCFLLQWFQV